MKTINCKFLSETSGYKCIIDSLSLTNEPIAISTHHKSNKSNKNVKILHFSLCTFDGFPTNIHDIFPELMCLKIKNSKFPHGIKRENFAQLNNLIELSITNCDLKVLPEDLLNDLLELENISFANNKIEEIDEKIFDNLFYLSFIDLRGNTNINIQYSGTNTSSTSLDDVKNAIKSMSLQEEKKFEILQEEN
ncbi:hypothetical protein PVAND_015542 [Polypedilum vanderplanki]|uniref:Leucine rich repeat protein n=1 Tax=Polypedilum vanderplanki TaxID=319348 RepID=A0A9J6BCW2_POLVA|nr:hypothetical protein PVAND_015542 [Polypedilum vanderplanki]